MHSNSFLLIKIFFLADTWEVGSETTCIWPIIKDSCISVTNPPICFAIFAALLAAAITDGSSVAIGIRYSLLLIIKFIAIPSGTVNIPIAFSIIWLAFSKENVDKGSWIVEMSLSDKFNVFFR